MSTHPQDVHLICEAPNLAAAALRLQQLGEERALAVCHALPDYPLFLTPLAAIDTDGLQEFLRRGGVEETAAATESLKHFLTRLLVQWGGQGRTATTEASQAA